MTTAEAQKLIDDRNANLWNLWFRGQPMPEIQPIEVAGPTTPDCEKAANLPGVVMQKTGLWSKPLDKATADAAYLAVYTCLLEYPLDLSDPAAVGLLTDDQRAWVRTYLQQRLVPCLQLLGYSVENREGGYIPGSGSDWNPYEEMEPRPTSAAEWESVDSKCPPPPIGDLDQPSGDE